MTLAGLPSTTNAALGHFTRRHATREYASRLRVQLSIILTSELPQEKKDDLIAFATDHLSQLATLKLHTTLFADLEPELLKRIEHSVDKRQHFHHPTLPSNRVPPTTNSR